MKSENCEANPTVRGALTSYGFHTSRQGINIPLNEGPKTRDCDEVWPPQRQVLDLARVHTLTATSAIAPHATPGVSVKRRGQVAGV